MAHNPSTNELSRQNAPTASIRSNDKSPSLRDKLLQVGVGRQEMFKIKLLEFVSAFDEFALKDTAYIVDEYMKELNQRTYLENENRKLKDAYTVLYGQKEQLAVQLAQVTTQQQRKQHELELSREHSTKEIDHSVSLSDDTASGNLARLQKEHDIAVSELYRAMDDVAKLNARVVHLEELNKVLSNNLTNKDNVNKELGQIVESKIMSIRKMDAELALATSLLSAKAVEAQAAIRMIGYCYAVLDPLVQENSKELADDLTYLKAAFERLPSSTVPHGQLQKTVEVHYQKVATDATNLQRIIESMGLPLQESMAPTTNTPQLVVGAMDSSNAPNNASGTKVVAKKAHRPTTHTKSISKGTKIDFTKDTRNHAVASSQTVSGNSPLPADVVPITTVPVNTNAINRNAPTQSSFTTNVITPATTEALPHSTPVLVPVTQPLKWKEPVVPTGAAFVHPHGSTVSPLAASSLSSISAAPVTSHIATAAPPQTSQAPALPQSAIMPVSSGRSQEPHETELATKPDGDKAQAKVTAKSDHGPSAKALEEKLKTADIQIQALISAATDSTDGRTGGQPTGSTHTLKASPVGSSGDNTLTVAERVTSNTLDNTSQEPKNNQSDQASLPTGHKRRASPTLPMSSSSFDSRSERPTGSTKRHLSAKRTKFPMSELSPTEPRTKIARPDSVLSESGHLRDMHTEQKRDSRRQQERYSLAAVEIPSRPRPSSFSRLYDPPESTPGPRSTESGVIVRDDSDNESAVS